FHAASSNAKSAQALLNHTPAGWKQSVLSYMLTDRLSAFHFHGNTDPFAAALRSALTSKDPVSLNLTKEALVALKGQVNGAFGKDDNGRYFIANRNLYDQLTFLRGPLGSALAAHIDEVQKTFETQTEGFHPFIEAKEMDRLLVLASGDRDAAVELQAAQAGHMLDTINDAQKANGGKNLDSELRPEARLFGHLLEARRLSLLAHAWSEEKARKDLQDTLSAAMSYLVSPVGAIGRKVAGEVGGQLGEKGAGIGFDKLAAMAAEQMIKVSITTKEALKTSNDQTAMVTWLMQIGVASARLADEKISGAALDDARNTRFVTNGNPPSIKPIHEIVTDPVAFDQFMAWARRHSDIEAISDNMSNTMNTARDTTHNNLGILDY
ncbi:hypothetical protein, partial [Nonomuraea sp. NPDC049309]|uniref:hypothetical protein n=1 Tax=Nonomuraea sp. NPDC049309 TaxID=3364350 RepID=UPI00371F9751